MFKKVISEGEAMPDFYGLAYRDFVRNQAVCYPIVINLVIRCLRELYFIIASSPGLSYSESEAQKIYRRGYEDGLEVAKRKRDDALLAELEDIRDYVRQTFMKPTKR